ncbi:MAG: amino acid ABC transporter permease [Clostridiales bacterium]|nr:amino acid ABC transporter permease [Clostridiales bacterium]
MNFYALGFLQSDFYQKFRNAFIVSDRYKLYFEGLGVTLKITVFAGLLGLLIGTAVAFMKLSKTRNGKPTVLSYIAQVYTDIIRGTPSVLQLMIMYFVVMASSKNPTLVAVLSFGINSGAYVSEIVRAGILAVDKGQEEAGRSLGLSSRTTMLNIIIPQAIKNALPPLGNEFIVLMKETAIVGYVGMTDLTRIANKISTRTYEAFMPLIGAAVIYFIIIKLLTIGLGYLERRLRKSDSR